MKMKKLMMIIFSSAAMIGTGIGITMLELRDWKSSEIRTDLLDKPVHTAVYERTVDLTAVDLLEIESKYTQGYFSRYQPETEVIYDKTQTGQVTVEIQYRGHQPSVGQSIYWYNEESAEEKVIHQLWIDINNYNDFVSVYDMAKSMFENQTYYTNGECTYVEKITLYTAYPDKIKT